MRNGAKERRPWTKVFQYIRRLNLLFSFLLMWMMLILFEAFRGAVDKMSGVDNQNSEWTFGQVFSAIAWVPILVEIFVIVRSKCSTLFC